VTTRTIFPLKLNFAAYCMASVPIRIFDEVVLENRTFRWNGMALRGTYRGSVQQGTEVMHGRGTYEGVDEDSGLSYFGEWCNGAPYGAGVWTYPAGAVYAGDWCNGCRTGRGILWSANGTLCFDGRWKEDCPLFGTILDARPSAPRLYESTNSFPTNPEGSALWLVTFDGVTRLYGDGKGWNKTTSHYRAGQLVAGGPPPRPHRGVGPMAPVWDATLEHGDVVVRVPMRGLTPEGEGVAHEKDGRPWRSVLRERDGREWRISYAGGKSYGEVRAPLHH
jgi:hypothetical protein